MMEAPQAKSYSRILVEFALGLRYEDIPTAVVANVKDHIIDTMGCLLVGSTMDWMHRYFSVAKRLGGPPEATLIGDGTQVGVANAALANGTLGRALDLDDTHFRAWEHVSAYIVPTAFTVGEWLGKSGREVITAAVAGYEVACRVGLARMGDRAFLHDPSLGAIRLRAASGTGSLFATTIEAGKLMGLSADALTCALGFAGNMGLFLGQNHREKTQAFPFSAGWSSHGGVIAAMIGESGLTGPREVFEGERGYFQALVAPDPHDVSRLVENLGVVWECAQGTIKLFPAGHGIHYFVNSLRALMQEEGLRPENVQEINCIVPQVRVEMHFTPRERVYRPGPYDARFSMPYVLAAMLVDGEVNVTSFAADKVRDPRLLEAAQRVTYTLDEESWLPQNRGRIVVKTRDGRTLERKSPHSQLPGTPENPVSRDEILKKFRDNASCALSVSATERLLRALENLEEVPNVRETLRMTVP